VTANVALAGYLFSPDHLNFGNLPPNPFGSPRVAELMDRLKSLNQMAKEAPSTRYSLRGGPTADELRPQVDKATDIAVNEFSRAMASNAVRKAALTALHLDDCMELYTLWVLHQTGWRSIQIPETVAETGQRVPATRRIAVYETIPGGPDMPTRYRTFWRKGQSLMEATHRILGLYGE
jgi:hypothetical protein